MLCAISGEAPEEPVVSKKSGTVYEKRLIEKYIEENGKEPVTGEELDLEDLLPIKTARIVRPRPPTLTSIPALLSAFQNEWDSLALETYNLKEQLARTREELATALYQHDAAVRVIARLTRERDEARDALSKITVARGAAAPATQAPNEDAMAIDQETLPEELAAHVDEVHQRLSKNRKKRQVPKEWATPDDVASFRQAASDRLDVSQPSSLAVKSKYAAIGGVQGDVAVYSLAAGKAEQTLQVGEPVTDTLFWNDSQVIVSTSKGSVYVFDNGDRVVSFSDHAGTVGGLSLHPGGEILASVGADKSLVFYHLGSSRRVLRVFTDSSLTTCAFHPDGHLFAAGTASGDIKIFSTKTGEEAAVFHLGSPVQAIAFSENGFWFAAAGKGEATVAIFDLRKEGEAAKVRELPTGEALSLAWDYSGQYLATAGPSGLTVQQYIKSSKAWSEPFRSGEAAVLVRWGDEAKSLVAVGKDGALSVTAPREEQ
ncbi:hypothetical protein VTK73DRAFT_6673 [Phialemonium thermophilum]|uniref:Pre-mRNA-processing factor 19 n=1 Tax=Phialemonium thermophilum TaxID=223376 RepID=A0ABR3WIA8_9PEZI